MSKFAFPSSRVTRIHGKHTYVEKITGAIRADIREESVGDRGYQVPQELCPCCFGVGQTPYGDPIDESSSEWLSEGNIPHDEDLNVMPMIPCRHCQGAGTVDEDDDPRDYEPEMFDEYRLQER